MSFIDRLFEEQRELKLRLMKLSEFIDSDGFRWLSSRQQFLLGQQQLTMGQYMSVLTLRIDDLAANPPTGEPVR